MFSIYSDRKRLFLDNWNSALGNKLMHTFFVANLAERHGRVPVIYNNTDVEKIFNINFKKIQKEDTPNISFHFEENDPFYYNSRILRSLKLRSRIKPKNLNNIILKCYESYLAAKNLLTNELPHKDIKIRGLFFEYELMPNEKIFNKYFEIKNEHKSYIEEKYPTLYNDNSVAVHYRGTDFKNHLNHIFSDGVILPLNYYKKAIEKIEGLLGSDLEYHLFSDDLPSLVSIFKDKKIVVHNDSPAIDWVGIHLIKNVIQSNSSFCWTASLYNKTISIQPEGGYNFKLNTGVVPFGFYHKDSYKINCTA